MALTRVRPGAEDVRVMLPGVPEPVEVEIELTNICNARCTVCPRTDMPAQGMMRAETLERILDGYAAARPAYALNRDNLSHPRVVFAGGGEPLLHREAAALMRQTVARGFSTHLITNGSRLTDEIADLGLASICVSFWGIQQAEYEAAMRLPFAETLARVERFAEQARAARLPLSILWVRTPEVTSSDAAIAAFWGERGIEVNMGDNAAWNRGGLVPLGRAPSGLPDPRRRVWCADLYFSDSYDWSGRVLLCCCNYFTKQQHVLGHVERDSPAEIARKKAELLAQRPLPEMCRVCEQPRRAQSQWMAAPWLPLLDDEERAMVTYDPAWSPS